MAEAGDVLWTATASGSNCGISVERSLRTSHPDAFRDRVIRLVDIDVLARGSLPEDPSALNQKLAILAHSLGKASQQWHVLGPLIEPNERPSSFADAWIRLKEARAMVALSGLVLTISAIGQDRIGGITLADTMASNVAKLNTRLANGEHITKLPRS